MFLYRLSISTFIYSLHMLIAFFFFFNDTATTEIYTLSLHDALPISEGVELGRARWALIARRLGRAQRPANCVRSEEHTSELQSHSDLVCRLLLEKKKKKKKNTIRIERTKTAHDTNTK